MTKNLLKIRDLALLGENLCVCHKCSDVKMFFRVIKELVNEDILASKFYNDKSVA